MAKVKVIRLITYEFDHIQNMELQLGKSMPDGIRDFGYEGDMRRITIRTLHADDKIIAELINLYGGAPLNGQS